jgi:hypothetical protein
MLSRFAKRFFEDSAEKRGSQTFDAIAPYASSAICATKMNFCIRTSYQTAAAMESQHAA